MTFDKKLKLLSIYMESRIDQWPRKFPSFHQWLKKRDKSNHRLAEEKKLQHLQTVCAYCGRSFIQEQLLKTKDHIIAKSIGGLDVVENILPCCQPCNSWKGSKTLEDWSDILRTIIRKDKRIKWPYNRILLGTMIGRIKKIIEDTKKKNSKISIYKI